MTASRTALALATTLALALAGCASDADDAAPASAADGAPAAPAQDEAPILSALSGCRALNAFGYVDERAFDGLVPANWTFTTPADGLAILRALLAECDDGAILVLSTPMFPDEASAQWHENPDVIFQVFVSRDADAPRWSALGIVAQPAAFEREPGPLGDIIRVATEDGLAFTMETRAAAAVPGKPYEFRAVYAAGTDAIAWLWGDEVSNDTARTSASMQAGPASRIAGAAVAQVIAAEWRAIDLSYRAGLPPEADE